MERHREQYAQLIYLAAILLAAMALRVIRLERQPLWWDEGNNIYFAHQSIAGLVRETIATHDADPPAYRLALAAWRLAAGSSPFAARYLSALMALAAIALTWVVARWLAGEQVALLSALLFAVSPMSVYYAREAKGYLLATICALLSVYAWGRRLGYLESSPKGGRRWWGVYILSTAAAIATHYYLAALALWQFLWITGKSVGDLRVSGGAKRQALRPLALWLLAALVIALLLLPWLIATFASAVSGAEGLSPHSPLTLGGYLSQVIGAWGAAAWSDGVQPTGWAALVIIAALALLAAIGAARTPHRAFVLTWLALPTVASFLIQARLSFFSPRFLLYLAPLWYLLVAQGIVTLARRRALVIAALALGVTALWLPGLREASIAPVSQAEDPRPWVAQLREAAQPGDALGYSYIWQIGYLFSYYPEHTLTSYRLWLTPESAESEMASIASRHLRFWLLDYGIAAGDPHNRAARWWDEAGYRLDSWRYGQHYLTLYASPAYETAGVGPEQGSAEFAGQIALRYPLIEATLAAGDYLAFTLEWQALAALSRDYQVFAHVNAADGSMLAQSDSAPGGSLTGEWQAGDVITDRRALRIPPDAAPGRYAVNAGLYRLSDGARLPVDGGDSVLLGYVEVERAE